MVWEYALGSVILVSVLSLIGVLALAIKKDFLKKILLILVAFSAGALTGGAFLHLLPEAVEAAGSFNTSISFYLFVGILLFFALEKFLRWRHCHDVDCDRHPKHLGTMNLIGDAAHNFIDGVLIGSSYLVSIPLGVTVTIAVIAHEIPQELGDFGVLIHSGFKIKKAIIYNFLSALTAVIGTIVALLIGARVEGFIHIMLPLTAGGFIYIALSGLVPELHKENSTLKSVIQFIVFILGAAIMYLLTL